ncbi:MAG TPA: hypothetical protein VMH26_15470 [Burkholderiales bacterium]|nr:hypothetical protein [Burkholderiales bacterium]
MSSDVLIPYIWAATGLVSLVAIVLLIYWAYTDHQFDENIKYQIFTEGDDDRYGRPRTR